MTLDALLTFWLTLSLGAFLLAQHARASPILQRRWMLLAWAATAGGVLTKGLVALLIPFCALVVYSLVTRDRAPWRRLHLGSGLVVLLVLAAPWFVLVSLRNPEFARFFFIHEHFERFLTTEHRRIGAWWYFVPMAVAGLLPWTGIFLWRLRHGWRDATVERNGFAWQRFCLVYAGFVLVFFSLSGSKLPSYILPMFPALALVLGWQLQQTGTRTLAAITGLLVVTTVALWLGDADRVAANRSRAGRCADAARAVRCARPVGEDRARRRGRRLRGGLDRLSTGWRARQDGRHRRPVALYDPRDAGRIHRVGSCSAPRARPRIS